MKYYKYLFLTSQIILIFNQLGAKERTPKEDVSDIATGHSSAVSSLESYRESGTASHTGDSGHPKVQYIDFGAARDDNNGASIDSASFSEVADPVESEEVAFFKPLESEAKNPGIGNGFSPPPFAMFPPVLLKTAASLELLKKYRLNNPAPLKEARLKHNISRSFPQFISVSYDPSMMNALSPLRENQ